MDEIVKLAKDKLGLIPLKNKKGELIGHFKFHEDDLFVINLNAFDINKEDLFLFVISQLAQKLNNKVFFEMDQHYIKLDRKA